MNRFLALVKAVLLPVQTAVQFVLFLAERFLIRYSSAVFGVGLLAIALAIPAWLWHGYLPAVLPTFIVGLTLVGLSGIYCKGASNGS